MYYITLSMYEQMIKVMIIQGRSSFLFRSFSPEKNMTAGISQIVKKYSVRYVVELRSSVKLINRKTRVLTK